MLRAERAYRNELRGVTIQDLIAKLEAADDGAIAARGCAFLANHLRHPKPDPKVEKE